jgi:hypothetical protein
MISHLVATFAVVSLTFGGCSISFSSEVMESEILMDYEDLWRLACPE